MGTEVKEKAEKLYLMRFCEDWADEHDVPALAIFDQKTLDKFKERKLTIYAYLGNGGDYFMEDEQGKTGADLIKSKVVEKYEVTEEFAKIFKKARLDSLSLSNIFDMSENTYDGGDYDEDEDEEIYK